jgi:hypothetical protein
MAGFTNYANLETTNNENTHWFYYNRMKKRFYLIIAKGSNFLHIFKTTYPGEVYDWALQSDVVRKSYFSYEKTLTIDGSDQMTDSARDVINLEYDLDTGQEIAICVMRRQWHNNQGSIMRQPWASIEG